MTVFNVTIDEPLRVFGVEPTNNWGAMLWGEKWAFGDLDVISETVFTVDEQLALSDDSEVGFDVNIDEIVNHTGSMYSETVTDLAGYDRVFQISTNAENRPLTSYNQISAPSSFTTFTHTSTSWTVL